MKNYFPIILCFAISSLISCNNAALEERVKELEAQLDECQNGAQKLFLKMKAAYDATDFELAKSIYNTIESNHPESEEYKKSQEIYSTIINKENALLEEKEKERKMKEAVRLASLKKLKKSFDDVSGITWYYNPYFEHYNNWNLISLYLGEKESETWIRLKMSYSGSDWIFFEKAFLSYDGLTKEIIFDKLREKDTDHNGGKVWEWIDVAIKESDIPYLMDFAASKNAKMRLTGKYTKTRSLTVNERAGIRDVINGYEGLK